MRSTVALPVLILCGCGGVLTWTSVFSTAAPDGKAEVHVQVNGCFADCVVRVVVKRGWHSDRIALRSDCIVNFAHAAWSGSRVGVFVDGGFCGPIKAAFDTASGQTIEFETVEDALKNAIITSYGVTPEELGANGGDVFQWSTYQGDGIRRRSMDEFRKRYPQ